MPIWPDSWKEHSGTCEVVSHDLIEIGKKKVLFTGTYAECIQWMSWKRKPTNYDIVSQESNRLMSWILPMSHLDMNHRFEWSYQDGWIRDL